MKRVAAITIFAFLLIQSGAFAQEGGKHGGKHKADPQMQKLHDMMPMYAQIQAKINEAIEKGDAAAVEAETGKILAPTPELKKAKPHKNLKEIKTLRKIASAFEGEVKATAAQSKKGDFAGAKAAFANAQKKCDDCHAKFRD
jgi:cytochrome c556